MWVRPGELHHRALDRHQLRVADRPRVMRRQGHGDANEPDDERESLKSETHGTPPAAILPLKARIFA